MASILLKTVVLMLAVLPILVIPVAILLAWRKLVSLGAKIFKRSEFHKMVSAMGTVCDISHVFDRKSFTIVTISQINQRNLDLSKLRRDFATKVLDAKIDQDELEQNLIYPELQCNLVEWLGYKFWAPCKDFDIKNHVKYLEDVHFPVINLDCPQSLKDWNDYITQGRIWRKDQPLWELLIKEFPVQDEWKTLLIWRSSHVLGDGWSVFNIWARLCDSHGDKNVPIAHVDLPQSRLTLSAILNNIWKCLKTPYEFVKYQHLVLSDSTKIPAASPCDKPKHSGPVETYTVNKPGLLMSEMKRIKNIYGVDFTSLILAGMTASVRNAFLVSGDPIQKDVRCGFIFPRAGHPQKLRNHTSLAVILIPISEEDSVKRLKLIAKRVGDIRDSYIAQVFTIVATTLGCMPMPLLRQYELMQKSDLPIVLTNVVGPLNTWFLNGVEIKLTSIGVNMAFKEDKGSSDYFSNCEQPALYVDAAIAEWKKLSERMDNNKSSKVETSVVLDE